ncbi:MAG: hypothetical protein NVS3B5_19810 [Sphingomicrobium sp.]
MTNEEDDERLYDRRAAEHTIKAEQTDDAGMKALHFELSARYQALAALGRRMALEDIYIFSKSVP